MTKIIFGTDGWRALMVKEFTLSKVKVVAQAIAEYMKDHGLEGGGVVVGYDTRKWSRRFADEVCRVVLGNGIPTILLLGMHPLQLQPLKYSKERQVEQ